MNNNNNEEKKSLKIIEMFSLILIFTFFWFVSIWERKFKLKRSSDIQRKSSETEICLVFRQKIENGVKFFRHVIVGSVIQSDIFRAQIKLLHIVFFDK